MDDRLEANKRLWNVYTGAHVKSEFYDVDGFRAGRKCLHPIELSEMGDVTGKSLLHLQCHFGLDTLSWERLGAGVTGVDFSEDAISFARQLTRDLGMNAEFICSDIHALPDMLNRQFDIVFTSYGVLTWLPDLNRWAEIIRHFLKPGGFFYMAEIHPAIDMFYDEDPLGDHSGLQVRGPYFKDMPWVFRGGQDYASDFRHELTTYEWQHPLGEVVTALVQAGLRLEYLHEFPECCYPALPDMTQKENGMWHVEGHSIPLTYSVKATI